MTGNEAILESLPDPLIMLDRERRIVRVNAAVTKSLGRDLPGRDLYEGVPGPGAAGGRREVLAGGSGRIVQFSVPGRLEYHYLARVAGTAARRPTAPSRSCRCTTRRNQGLSACAPILWPTPATSCARR